MGGHAHVSPSQPASREWLRRSRSSVLGLQARDELRVWLAGARPGTFGSLLPAAPALSLTFLLPAGCLLLAREGCLWNINAPTWEKLRIMQSLHREAKPGLWEPLFPQELSWPSWAAPTPGLCLMLWPEHPSSAPVTASHVRSLKHRGEARPAPVPIQGAAPAGLRAGPQFPHR